MATKTKTHNSYCSLGITCMQPTDCGKDIAEDLTCISRVLVLPPQCKIRIGVAKLQRRRGSSEESNREG